MRVQELYTSAKAAQSQGNFADAISDYKSILQIAPTLGAAYTNLGTLYFRQREYAQAVAVLEKGLKVDPHTPGTSALLGICLYESGDFPEARPRLEAAIRANASDHNARMYLARDVMKLGDLSAAGAQLEALLTRDPKNQEAWYLMAKVHMLISEQALAKMNSIDPNSVWAHQLSGEVMESMNNFDGAVVELKKAVDLAPQMPNNHYKLADAYWHLSQWDSAAEQFQAELDVNPGNCQARWKLGSTILQKNGDAKEALRQIDDALARCPTLTDARVDRARALLRLDRGADALTDLERAKKENGSDPAIHFLMAKVYRLLGRSQEAQAEMEMFTKLDETARAATAERAQEVIRNKQFAH